MNYILEGIQKRIWAKGYCNVFCGEWRSSIVLSGTVANWDEVVAVGKLAAKMGCKGVVNKVEVPGLMIPEIKKPLLQDNALDNKQVDVLVIGGGVIGCAISRELAKWDISLLLVEKEADLAMHTSSRNAGMVHAGFEPSPGSKKAYFNVRGNILYSKVTAELDVPFRRCGSNLLYARKWLKLFGPVLKGRAHKNGVEGVYFLSKEELKRLEPAVTDNVTGALHLSMTGIVSPYKMTIAYAENAVMNGAEVSLDTIVLSMEQSQGKIQAVITNRGKIYPKVVINAAGVYADKIAAMANDQFFTIHPRKGELAFLDKKKGSLINSVISKPSIDLANGNTKGGALVKTIDGNVLVGPDAYEQPYREDYTTNKENIDHLLAKHLPLVPQFAPSDVITYCAGIRAATYEEDFIVEASEYVKNLVYAAGIQSPGLASAPAIAEEIEKITCRVLADMREVKPKAGWNPRRQGIPELKHMTVEERNNFIKQRPDYGTIVCRCEEISKGEIVEALHSPVPVQTVDGIKRRVRPGMGRCQGSFCLPHVMQIMKEEKGEEMTTLTKKGNASYILTARIKQMQ